MSLSPGVRLGDFVIKKMLGRGGMAIVWLAEGRGERVAVKEPILDTAERERNIKFLRHEGIILSKVKSDYVCKLYAMYETKEGKVPLLVLEYLDGGSLKEQAPITDVKKLKNVAYQILYGLSDIHSRGIIHRDIKPSNLMIGGGVVKLVDFGTAISHQEKALEVVISPGGYTAPEQLRGVSLFQSDIWSVGATLVYLYTGKHPCRYMKKYDCQNPAPGVEISVEAPSTGDSTLDQFISIALSPNYRRRFFDANEAVAFLDGALPKGEGLKLKIRTKLFMVKTSEIVVGRSDNPKDDLKIEGQMLYIYDPNQYISRRHLHVKEIQGQWYVRDLGSTNGTAIFRDKWVNIWRGKGVDGPWVKLEDGDIIAIGYDDKKGPYELIGVRL
ncbi:MAG: FHA domain-containing serine/threonine-protein kinase [Pyrobaculum sp.]